jgi:hypothetical protein
VKFFFFGRGLFGWGMALGWELAFGLVSGFFLSSFLNSGWAWMIPDWLSGKESMGKNVDEFDQTVYDEGW